MSQEASGDEYNAFFNNLMAGVDSSSDDDDQPSEQVSNPEPKINETQELQPAIIKDTPITNSIPKIDKEEAHDFFNTLSNSQTLAPKPEIKTPAPPVFKPTSETSTGHLESVPDPTSQPQPQPTLTPAYPAPVQPPPTITKKKAVINRGNRRAVVPPSIFGGVPAQPPKPLQQPQDSRQPVAQEATDREEVEMGDGDKFETIHIDQQTLSRDCHDQSAELSQQRDEHRPGIFDSLAKYLMNDDEGEGNAVQSPPEVTQPTNVENTPETTEELSTSGPLEVPNQQDEAVKESTDLVESSEAVEKENSDQQDNESEEPEE